LSLPLALAFRREIKYHDLLTTELRRSDHGLL
jgi:hypothetical protein